MRILLITSVNILLKSGGGFVNRALYDSLLTHFPGQVDVIQYDEHGPSDEGMNFIHLPRANCLCKIVSIARGHIHRLYPWIKEYICNNKGAYSVCIVNSSLFGDVVPFLKSTGIKVITIHHNFEAIFQKDNKRPTTFWGLTSFFVKKNERVAYIQSDVNVFLSEYDKKMMLQEYGDSNNKNVVVGIYETKEQSEEKRVLINNEEINRNSIAICGSLDCLQTEIGINDFKNRYFVICQELLRSSLSIIIAGRNPRASIVNFSRSYECIKLIPNPDNINTVINRCGIYLCPTNVGSGVKLRILDGVRAGMPIISHKVSARGYEAFFDKDWFFQYDDEDSFKKSLKSAILYLDTNQDSREKIINDYKSVYSFESGDKRFINVVFNLLEECK